MNPVNSKQSWAQSLRPWLCCVRLSALIWRLCLGGRVCKCHGWTVDGERCKSFFFKAEEQTAANNDGVNERLPSNPAAFSVKAAGA